MMRMIGIALCLLFLAAPAAADQLSSIQVFGTHFACNQGHQDLWAVNPVGRDIRIKATTIWMGLDIGQKADFGAWLWTYNREQNALRLAHVVGWDRYAEPTTHSTFRQRYAPDWIALAAGEYLRLVTFCNGTGGMGETAVFIEYTVP